MTWTTLIYLTLFAWPVARLIVEWDRTPLERASREWHDIRELPATERNT